MRQAQMKKARIERAFLLNEIWNHLTIKCWLHCSPASV